jgi:hypothetical protein
MPSLATGRPSLSPSTSAPTLQIIPTVKFSTNDSPVDERSRSKFGTSVALSGSWLVAGDPHSNFRAGSVPSRVFCHP